MDENKGTPLWKVMLVSGVVSAISTLGLYYVEHPEKMSQTKDYILKKVGYDVENVRKIRTSGVTEEDLNDIVKRQVCSEMKKYLPNI